MSILEDDSFMTDGEFFDSLIPGLQERARRIVHEKQLTDRSELFDRVRFFLSQHYNIPMRSKVFDDYTPEDMYYEYFIIQECKKSDKDAKATVEEKAQETVDVVNDNREALKGLFDDFRKPKVRPEPQEDNLFSEEEQAGAWNKLADDEGFF